MYHVPRNIGGAWKQHCIPGTSTLFSCTVSDNCDDLQYLKYMWDDKVGQRANQEQGG
jgi:hypothetical protein